jgi:hypothetical protein
LLADIKSVVDLKVYSLAGVLVGLLLSEKSEEFIGFFPLGVEVEAEVVHGLVLRLPPVDAIVPHEILCLVKHGCSCSVTALPMLCAARDIHERRHQLLNFDIIELEEGVDG